MWNDTPSIVVAYSSVLYILGGDGLLQGEGVGSRITETSSCSMNLKLILYLESEFAPLPSFGDIRISGRRSMY